MNDIISLSEYKSRHVPVADTARHDLGVVIKLPGMMLAFGMLGANIPVNMGANEAFSTKFDVNKVGTQARKELGRKLSDYIHFDTFGPSRYDDPEPPRAA